MLCVSACVLELALAITCFSLHRMLAVDPLNRITLDAVLLHPWIVRHTPRPDIPFDTAHIGRLRQYAMRRKVKVAALVAAFGAGHLKKARELRMIVRAQVISPADFSALSGAFHRLLVESVKSGSKPTQTVDLEQFRRVLASVPVTALLPADRLFTIFDTGTWFLLGFEC